VQELERDPRSHAHRRAAIPSCYFPPRRSRLSLDEGEGLLCRVALLSHLVNHGAVAGLDGRVTDVLWERTVAGEHDGRDPLLVIREVTQIELRHDVMPSRLPRHPAHLVPHISGVEANPFTDKSELQIRVSIAPCRPGNTSEITHMPRPEDRATVRSFGL
jgi:hypothetical protein